jgi:hypothetical protein
MFLYLCARVAGGLYPTDLLVRLIHYLFNSYEKKAVFSELNTVGCARTNVIVSITSFVVAYVRSSIQKIYVFRGNPFQAHSLEQCYHPTQPFKQENIIQNKKYKCKNNIKLII